MASADVAERKLIRQRGGDIFRLESAQAQALQAFVTLWSDSEKLAFIKMYAEKVSSLESRSLYRASGASHACRKNSVTRWLIGAILLFTLFFLSSAK